MGVSVLAETKVITKHYVSKSVHKQLQRGQCQLGSLIVRQKSKSVVKVEEKDNRLLEVRLKAS